MRKSVGTFAPQAEGWMFESKPRQNEAVKTGSDSSTAKRSIDNMCKCRGSLIGDNHYKRMPRVTVGVAANETLSAQ